MIAARALHKRFGRTSVITAVDLQAGRGECLVIAGPAGAGKTTLLRMLAGVSAPTSGSIELDGERVEPGSRARRRIAFADGWIDPAGELTVGEFLAFSGAGAATAARAGLDPRAPIGRLSMTQARRLSTAAVLGSTRDVLILDDAFEDERELPDLVDWVGERRRAGASVIVSGRMSHAQALDARMLSLADGPRP